MSIRLSKTSLGLFEECQRCFYLKMNHKVGRPESISSKVWKGIEREQIAHHERHRSAGTLPEELRGQVPEGSVFYRGDRIELRALRYWGKGLRFAVDRFEVSTALDDMLQREEGGRTVYNCWDDKTKSKATTEEDTRELYQTQADVFDLAMNVNGYPTDGRVFFGYWHPASVVGARPAESAGGHGTVVMDWRCQVIMLKADHARVKDLVLRAGACLEGPLPSPAEECEFCGFMGSRRLVEAALAESEAARHHAREAEKIIESGGA